MRLPRQSESVAAEQTQDREGLQSPDSSGSELERKYRIALALYVGLAALVWFTIGEGKIAIFGRLIDIRFVPIFVIATFAFRTVMAMQAERIRRSK